MRKAVPHIDSDLFEGEFEILGSRILDKLTRPMGELDEIGRVVGIDQARGVGVERGHLLRDDPGRGDRHAEIPDVDLELAETAGCSGFAYAYGQPVLADLTAAARDPSKWGMTALQQAKIPKDRKSMISVPIFAMTVADDTDPPMIGTLSADSKTDFGETMWARRKSGNENDLEVNPELLDLLMSWANTITTVFS